VPDGIHHIIIGRINLLVRVGDVLGGKIVNLLLVVTSFYRAHSITLPLAGLKPSLTTASAALEPAIALSIYTSGADNILAKGGSRRAGRLRSRSR